MRRRMPTEAELIKKWKTLTFTDNFIFSRVMHDQDICRQVVELILGVKIGAIQYLSAQDEHKTDPPFHEDSHGRVFTG